MQKPSVEPSFAEFQSYAKKFSFVPVWKSILLDKETPVSLFAKLESYKRPLFLLESVEGQLRFARYSFIGLDSFGTFSWGEKKKEIPPLFAPSLKEDPFSTLESLLHFSAPRFPHLPSFYGGLVGFIGYEAARYIERVPIPSSHPLGTPDFFFHIPRSLLIFDHYKHTLTLLVLNFTKKGGLKTLYEESRTRIAQILTWLAKGENLPKKKGKGEVSSRWTSNFSPSAFKEAVRKARDLIIKGECIQVVPSQRFSLHATLSDLSIYRGLRFINPSPYMFLLRTPYLNLIGASPELLVRVKERECTIRPIAGTRPRGRTEKEDRRLEAELISDEKERAEHVMLVDLGRNDVGRVAKIGTVRVSDYMKIERYSHVMHIVSEVSGKLAKNVSAVSALKSAFPAGTVTGAPKLRAMEIIAELEPSQRGPYAGACGYLSFTGEMDMAIVIRTLFQKGGSLHVQAGAGVVYDSKPQKEWEETVNKAKGMLRAVSFAQKELLL